jgi:predicted negative regulator of RcsB-dependent stress response
VRHLIFPGLLLALSACGGGSEPAEQAADRLENAADQSAAGAAGHLEEAADQIEEQNLTAGQAEAAAQNALSNAGEEAVKAETGQ